jgi:ATP-dependent Lhr-like helicase
LIARHSADAAPASTEFIADVLLRRYGIMFRALLARETAAPPWQELLRVYRKKEAQGEIRGGRFVAGHYGEQFALPEAVESLRALRKQTAQEEICVVSAADPLNLIGIVTPGAKLSALTGNRILYKNGIPTAALTGKETRWLTSVDKDASWPLENRLIRRTVPPQLKAYL